MNVVRPAPVRAAAPVADHAPLLERAFDAPPAEGSYRIDGVEGELPGFVRGTYYLNGPARFRRGGRDYRHWLDGDGMVCALRLGDDGVSFTNRFVRSRKLVAEEAAGRALFRTFGTAFEGDRLLRGVGLESPVNVSVYPFGGKLLAFGEQGLPWELDPATLETRGQHTFDGRLNAVTPFSAHPAFDPASGEMFNFGVSFSSRRPCLNFYRFDATGGLRYRRRLALDAPASIHDFGLSRRFATVYASPHLLAVDELLERGSSLLEALSWQPERGSQLMVIERDSGEERARIAIGSAYCLHLIDTFEDGELLFVDVLEMDQPVYDQYEVPNLFPDARGSTPVRYAVDVEARRLVGRTPLDYGEMCDFPVVDPRRAGAGYRDFWALAIGGSDRAGRKFFDRLAHFDWQTGKVATWQAPPRVYLSGEPAFVPAPGGGRDGAVLCPQFDAERRASSFLVFDALAIAAGPGARLRLRRPIHLGFHAVFSADGTVASDSRRRG